MSILILIMFFQIQSETLLIYFDKVGIISPLDYLNKDTVIQEFKTYLKKNTLINSYYVQLDVDLMGIIVEMSRYYNKKLNRLKKDIKSAGEGMEHPEKFASEPTPSKSQEEALGNLIIASGCCLLGFTISTINYWASIHEFKETSKKAQWIYRKIVLGKLKVFTEKDTLYSDKFIFIKDKVDSLPSNPFLLKRNVKKDFKELRVEFVNYLNSKLENIKGK